MDPAQHSGQGFTSQDKSYQNRSYYSQKARYYHFLDGGTGANVNTTSIIGFGLSFHQTGDFPELSPYFLYHFRGGSANCTHSQSTEEKWQHGATKTPYHYHGG
jgi:hypothetical protein